MFEKHNISLSLLILILATGAIFAPLATFIALVIILSALGFFCFPALGLTVIILATLLGEFGRINFLGTSTLLLATDLIAPFLLIIWIVRKFIKKEKIYIDRTSSVLLYFWGAGILSLAVGSTALSGAELKFAIFYLFRFIAISGLFFIARDLTKNSRKKILNTLLFVGALFALSGFIILKLIPDFHNAGLTEFGWDPHIGRLTSTWLDPNFAAGGFAFLIALAGGYFLHIRKIGLQILFFIIIGLMSSALLFTFSRSGLLALGVSGLILGFLGNRKILVAMLIISILGITTSPRLAKRLEDFAQSAKSLTNSSQQILDPTAQLRADSWHEGWKIWQENPIFGVGFGTYKFHQTFVSDKSHAATGSDASLLNVGATTGIIGFLLFIFFLVSLINDAWQARKTRIGIGFLAALGGILVHSIFVNSLFFTPIAIYFFIGGGIIPVKKPVLTPISSSSELKKSEKAHKGSYF